MTVSPHDVWRVPAPDTSIRKKGHSALRENSMQLRIYTLKVSCLLRVVAVIKTVALSFISLFV